MAGAMAEASEVPLPEVAFTLGTTYVQARDMLFKGILSGRKKGVHWVVDRESVEREKAARAQPVAA